MPYICDDCPRRCHAERGVQGAGFCHMGEAPVLARAALHYDEEPVISGTRGAGTVFFSGCNLRCVFCQNYDISAGGHGKTVTPERLREICEELIAQESAIAAQAQNIQSATSFFPEYTFTSGSFSAAWIAALFGLIVTAGLCYGVTQLVTKRKKAA